jgi:hypothetical protein
MSRAKTGQAVRPTRLLSVLFFGFAGSVFFESLSGWLVFNSAAVANHLNGFTVYEFI